MLITEDIQKKLTEISNVFVYENQDGIYVSFVEMQYDLTFGSWDANFNSDIFTIKITSNKELYFSQFNTQVGICECEGDVCRCTDSYEFNRESDFYGDYYHKAIQENFDKLDDKIVEFEKYSELREILSIIKSVMDDDKSV